MAIITTQSWNAAVAQQFPFLSGTLKSLTDRAEIGKVSEELLDLKPSEHYGTDLSGYRSCDVVELWDGEGVKLGEVVPETTHADARDMSGDQAGETVGDAIASLADPSKLRFITRLQIEEGGCLSHDPDSSVLTIYKVAEFAIGEWLEERKRKAGAAVQAALGSSLIDPVCAECGKPFDGGPTEETYKGRCHAACARGRRFVTSAGSGS